MHSMLQPLKISMVVVVVIELSSHRNNNLAAAAKNAPRAFITLSGGYLNDTTNQTLFQLCLRPKPCILVIQY